MNVNPVSLLVSEEILAKLDVNESEAIRGKSCLQASNIWIRCYANGQFNFYDSRHFNWGINRGFI